MIIFFSDIKQQPGRVLIDIFDFLDLESSFKPEGLKNKDNASKVPRFQKTYAWAKNLVTKLYDWDLVFLIDLAKKFGLKKLFFSGSNNQDFPPLTDELREELAEYYINDVKKLSELLGKDLVSKWDIKNEF